MDGAFMVMVVTGITFTNKRKNGQNKDKIRMLMRVRATRQIQLISAVVILFCSWVCNLLES